MVAKKKTDNQELEQKIAELTTDLQRVHADFVNFRRRSDEERGAILELAKQDVILQLLPLIDNLERALAHTPVELADNDWAKGVGQVARQVQDFLKRLGLNRIEAVGQPFDPSLHEAVSMEDGTGDQEVVTEELQAGYRLGDRVLRHSVVRVGKK